MADRSVIIPNVSEADLHSTCSKDDAKLLFVSERALLGQQSPRISSPQGTQRRSPRSRSSVTSFLEYNPQVHERLRRSGAMPDVEALFFELDKQLQRYQEELATAKLENRKLQEGLEEEQQKGSVVLVSELALQTQVKNLQQQNDSLREENGKLQSSLLTEQQQLQEDLYTTQATRQQLAETCQLQACELKNRKDTIEHLEKEIRECQSQLIRVLDKAALLQEQQQVDNEARLALQGSLLANDRELAVAVLQAAEYKEALDELKKELQVVREERDSAELCIRNVLTKRRLGQEVAVALESLTAELLKVKTALQPPPLVDEILPVDFVANKKPYF